MNFGITASKRIPINQVNDRNLAPLTIPRYILWLIPKNLLINLHFSVYIIDPNRRERFELNHGNRPQTTKRSNNYNT